MRGYAGCGKAGALMVEWGEAWCGRRGPGMRVVWRAKEDFDAYPGVPVREHVGQWQRGEAFVAGIAPEEGFEKRPSAPPERPLGAPRVAPPHSR